MRRRLITHKGRTQSVTAWEYELGLSPKGIQNRLRAGWSIQRALETRHHPTKGRPRTGRSTNVTITLPPEIAATCQSRTTHPCRNNSPICDRGHQAPSQEVITHAATVFNFPDSRVSANFNLFARQIGDTCYLVGPVTCLVPTDSRPT